jgi:predicted AAA+ superfamily ATPase
MLPLSFKEYVSAANSATIHGAAFNLPQLYARYLSESSFPYTLELSGEQTQPGVGARHSAPTTNPPIPVR